MSRTKGSVGLAVLVALALAVGLVSPAVTLAQNMPGTGMGMMGPSSSSPMRGCGSGQQNVSAPAIAELPRVTVNIYDTFFDPSAITVNPGTVVVWTNRGTKPHSTTAWNRWSEVLNPGESCMAWFVTPGTYEYLSIVAADGGALVGTVTVGGQPIGGGTSTGSMGGTSPSPMNPGTGPGMAPGTGQPGGSGSGN